MAELRPVVIGMSLTDFQRLMKSAPHLSKADADKFAEDLKSIRKDPANYMITDPWKSS